jgi:hypothetical protein
VNDMNELQQALVADHISSLEHEGALLRAERRRDLARSADEAGAGRGSRARLGHWLVSIGEAIAGPTADCDEGDRLSSAA